MATFTTQEIKAHNMNTKAEIKALSKPLNAYHLYCQDMRHRWANLPEHEKSKYEVQAQQATVLYEEKKEDILEKAREKIREKKIFLCYTTGRVPCVGLDNGFTTQQMVGPVDELEIFTEAEKQKLIARGVPEQYIGKYKSVGGSKFNWRAAKKWGVTVYGGSQNYQPCWGGLRENYEGKSGKFTHYNNYKGETWTENY
jgi:hypothetical protein